jgi:hypothetical protein
MGRTPKAVRTLRAWSALMQDLTQMVTVSKMKKMESIILRHALSTHLRLVVVHWCLT